MPKLFSVITINYNNLDGLKRTFESVHNQTSRHEIDFVVVDGNSSDSSAEFLRENANSIDSLTIEKDKGIYDAMNKGIALAKGKYLWFVNSGDIIFSNTVAEELTAIASESPDVIFGDTMFTDNSGKEIGLISQLKPQPLPQKLNSESFRYGMCLCHQSFLVKKELSPNYNLAYRQAADIDWILNILKKNPSNLRFDGVIAGFETGGSSYQNEKTAWKERYAVLKAHYGAIPNILAHIWIVMRRMLFKFGIWKL